MSSNKEDSAKTAIKDTSNNKTAMRAVFLDCGTFLETLELPKPDRLKDYKVYDATEQDNEQIIERCKDADILITNKIKIDREVIEALPNLKLIQLTATGINNVDKQAAQDNHIELYNVAGYAVKSVPEHTLMLMLNGMRAGIYYHEQVINGNWRESNKFTLTDTPIIDLEDKTLGIIGAGHIGKRVTKLAKAFGMQVLWAEHQGKEPRDHNYTAFNEVLAYSDVISLHIPLTEQTKHIINTETLATMTQRPLIVNVARGGLVDSQAMVDAVQNEQVLGYVTDVFEEEPIVNDDPLLMLAKDKHPRVMFSPHNAWGSIAAQKKLWHILTDQVNDFIDSNRDSNSSEDLKSSDLKSDDS